jgi:hypothetical protein
VAEVEGLRKSDDDRSHSRTVLPKPYNRSSKVIASGFGRVHIASGTAMGEELGICLDEWLRVLLCQFSVFGENLDITCVIRSCRIQWVAGSIWRCTGHVLFQCFRVGWCQLPVR